MNATTKLLSPTHVTNHYFPQDARSAGGQRLVAIVQNDDGSYRVQIQAQQHGGTNAPWVILSDETIPECSIGLITKSCHPVSEAKALYRC